MVTENLSEYERKRIENIKRNDEIFAALKIQSKAGDLNAASKGQRVGIKSYKLNPEKKRSLRTQGMPPDFVDGTKKSQKFCGQNESSVTSMNGSLRFEDACVEKKSYRALVDTILRVTKKTYLGEIKEEFATILDLEMKPRVRVSVEEEEIDGVKACKDENLSEKCDLDGVTKSEIDELMDSSARHNLYSFGSIEGMVNKKSEIRSTLDLRSLALKPENIARVMLERILVVTFFPCTDVRTVVAGSSDGTVGFWNLDHEEERRWGIFV